MIKANVTLNNNFSFSQYDYTDKQGELRVVEHYHDFYEIYYVESGYCNY